MAQWRQGWLHFELTKATPYLILEAASCRAPTLHGRHNDHDGVSIHQPHGGLLNLLFGRRSKKTSKLRVTGLCAGNSPGPVNFPHKGPVTRKMFPFDDVIMIESALLCRNITSRCRCSQYCNPQKTLRTRWHITMIDSAPIAPAVGFQLWYTAALGQLVVKSDNPQKISRKINTFHSIYLWLYELLSEFMEKHLSILLRIFHWHWAGQSCDCPSARGVILNDIGKWIYA